MLCGGVGSEPSKWGISRARTSCPKCKKDLSLTYHWPMPSNTYLSYLNISQLPHLPDSQVRNTNCNWHMVSWCFMFHQFACHFVGCGYQRSTSVPRWSRCCQCRPWGAPVGCSVPLWTQLLCIALPSATKGTSGTSTWTPALWTIGDVKPVSCR